MCSALLSVPNALSNCHRNLKQLPTGDSPPRRTPPIETWGWNGGKPAIARLVGARMGSLGTRIAKTRTREDDPAGAPRAQDAGLRTQDSALRTSVAPPVAAIAEPGGGADPFPVVAVGVEDEAQHA